MADPATDENPPAAARKLPPGVRLHGALDLAFAALYAWLGLVAAPSRSRAFVVALSSLCALLAAAGGALLVGARVGRRLAIVAQGALLLFAATVVLLLALSAAYLRGIYGPLGRGMGLLCLVAAALVVELCGLLPLFQLRLLLREDVRRFFSTGTQRR